MVRRAQNPSTVSVKKPEGNPQGNEFAASEIRGSWQRSGTGSRHPHGRQKVRNVLRPKINRAVRESQHRCDLGVHLQTCCYPNPFILLSRQKIIDSRFLCRPAVLGEQKRCTIFVQSIVLLPRGNMVPFAGGPAIPIPKEVPVMRSSRSFLRSRAAAAASASRRCRSRFSRSRAKRRRGS